MRTILLNPELIVIKILSISRQETYQGSSYEVAIFRNLSRDTRYVTSQPMLLSRRFQSTTCLRGLCCFVLCASPHIFIANDHFQALKQSGLPLPKLDIKSIVSDIEAKERNIRDRNYGAIISSTSLRRISDLYGEHKAATQQLSALRNTKSKFSASIRDASSNEMDKKALLAQSSGLKQEIHDLSSKISHLEAEMNELASLLPNDTHPATPIGAEGSATILHQSNGKMGQLSISNIRDHVNIAASLQLTSMEAGSVVTGSSWAYLLNEAALLEQALTAFALATAYKHGFQGVSGPDVVRSHIAERCGFHPRDEKTFGDQAYTLGPKHQDLVLSGTAEIPLAGLYADNILDLGHGPLKLAAFGRAFRMEAGARGRDTRGLYRLHQFSKVELFTLSASEESESSMEEMLSVQKEIVESLGIPYR
jgi:seryl-tRNA synthetase